MLKKQQFQNSMPPQIKVIIPAYNEEDSIAKVIAEIPDFVDEIIVVSNNSTDATEANAHAAGATVLVESRKGYGYACLQGNGLYLKTASET